MIGPVSYVVTLQHLRVGQFAHLLRDRLFRAFGCRPRPSAAELKAPAPEPLRARLDLPPQTRLKRDGSVSIDLFGADFTWREGGDWYSDTSDGLRAETLYYLEFLQRFAPEESGLAGRVALDFLRWAPPKTPQYAAYTASRRLITLTHVAARLPRTSEVRRRLLAAAAAHARLVFRHTEHHLSANHLFKCAKGLLWAGLFLRHAESARWLHKGAAILARQLRRQFLPSGCHYERCPGYHCAVLEDLLDTTAALRTTRRLPRLRRRVESVTQRALAFLAAILHPDGSLPLFGDTAAGPSPRPADLFAAAKAAGFRVPSPQEGAFAFPDAGFYGCRLRDDFLIVTAGRTGAPDQPGHAHCDFGSFELSWGGGRVVTDTGTHDYAADARRDLVRSTAAHNVAQPNGLEQARFWAAHRFATLVHPRVVRRDYDERKQELKLTLVSSAYRARGLLWRRRLLFRPGALRIDDSVSGARIVSRLHFHPALRLESTAPSTASLVGGTCRLTVLSDGRLSAGLSPYWPRFCAATPERISLAAEAAGNVRLELRRGDARDGASSGKSPAR